MNLGIPASVIDHLWQSTLFSAVVWATARALGRHDARVRYWLWAAASAKFVVPFSWLIAAASQIPWTSAAATTTPVVSFVAENVLVPPVGSFIGDVQASAVLLAQIVVALWLGGMLIVAITWWWNWRPIRSALRAATPWQPHRDHDTRGLRILSSPSALEPGVVGLWRPVLLVPEALFDRLTPPQLNAVFAHEHGHVRHRDNLIAVMHMAIEAVFWFHPLVWWIERRLIDERERACDEAVIRAGHAPADYAEGILTVCRFTIHAPLACMAGVSGSDLRRRIETIFARTTTRTLGRAHKLLLVLAAIAGVGGPTIAGALAAPRQSAATDEGPRLEFDAASVRRAAEGQAGLSFNVQPGGHLRAPNNPIMNLLGNAYGIPAYRISGAPEWVSADRYDIDATAGREVSEAETMRMLQSLLEERFRLKVHRELKDRPVYALRVAKGGAKLQRSTDDGCSATAPVAPLAANQPPTMPTCGSNLMSAAGAMLSWRAVRIDMASAANALARAVRRPVVDRTGLTGFFDITIALPRVQPDAAADSADAGPSLFTVLREQLGLTLEPARAPVDMLVVDHIERPTDN